MSKSLEELRKEIDRIDSQLVTLLAERFQVTEAVGVLKKEQDVAAQDLGREAELFERLTILANQAGVDPTAITAIWRTIIDEVIKRHTALRAERNE